MRIINIEAERGGWGGGGQEENPRRISPRGKKNFFSAFAFCLLGFNCKAKGVSCRMKNELDWGMESFEEHLFAR